MLIPVYEAQFRQLFVNEMFIVGIRCGRAPSFINHALFGAFSKRFDKRQRFLQTDWLSVTLRRQFAPSNGWFLTVTFIRKLSITYPPSLIIFRRKTPSLSRPVLKIGFLLLQDNFDGLDVVTEFLWCVFHLERRVDGFDVVAIRSSANRVKSRPCQNDVRERIVQKCLIIDDGVHLPTTNSSKTPSLTKISGIIWATAIYGWLLMINVHQAIETRLTLAQLATVKLFIRNANMFDSTIISSLYGRTLD
ncbi:hypothetical protein CDAR_171381 [Caerostris darwini]|uniref:Uncharacterized protein n=1 Tax=Caerostris darwini TaxID=1538125 RepID=A0AAV4WMZ6_9ARAC|nr:hypothetical protein CDAR_171381 [Caerostris darwini]